MPHRLDTDIENSGDLSLRETPGDVEHNVPLPPGEQGRSGDGRLGKACSRPVDDYAVQYASGEAGGPARYRPGRGRDLLERLALAQVA
jgi:hypothetical protein